MSGESSSGLDIEPFKGGMRGRVGWDGKKENKVKKEELALVMRKEKAIWIELSESN